ncbi:helix-turn-helix transcriptional regulator [Roseibium sp. M-1]
METIVRNIDACLTELGSETFAQAYVAFAEALGIDQIMVFSIEEARARCLLSWHFSKTSMAGELAETYLDGWYRQDPLLQDLLDGPTNSVTLRRLSDIEARMTPDYRHLFFEAPGLKAKTTLLAVGETLRLFVSLYQGDPAGPECDADLARLAGRLALLHFEHMSDTGLPPPLAALSEREQAVCLGILSGYKAEAIAAELDVAPSTVITYRKRAYAKLGVTSRAGLFAICGK